MSSHYQKPSIVRVGNPLYAKHGSSAQSYHFVRDSIEGVKVQDLVQQFGSPLFVFSERSLKLKYNEAITALSRHCPQVVFGWSYKTNYLNGICKIFHQSGAVAEVVSQFEYEKARALGIPGNQIIFNGPHKPRQTLKKGTSRGSASPCRSLL